MNAKHTIILVFYILLIFSGIFTFARKIQSFPCPGVFSYEEMEEGDNKWYGDITIKATKNIQSPSLTISLDRPSDLLAIYTFMSLEGDVTTSDNRVYVASGNEAIRNGNVYNVRIMVKFDREVQMPLLQSIRFSEQQICPSDGSAVSLGRPSSKPDFPGSVPSDVTSDYAATTSSTSRTSQHESSDVECGTVTVAQPLILGGEATQKGQWPWHIALYRIEGVNTRYICGGSLVSKNKVITAAHCLLSDNTIVNKNSLLIYLGKYSLKTFGDEVQTKQVSSLKVNPLYNSSTFYGDIAILTLSSDVVFSMYVRPVCIWESSSGISDIVDVEGCVVGWGRDEEREVSEELKVARIPVVSNEVCLRSNPTFYSLYTSDMTFCAGYRNGTSPCNGDSGGGFVIKRGNAWYLRGVVSLSVPKDGLGVCNPEYYIVFTDTSKYSNFIQRNL